MNKSGYNLYFAWLISLLATIGSLYISEGLGQTPCFLCWAQRIFMFPLVFILGLATYRSDYRIAPYGILLASLGGGVALFHTLEQYIPGLGSIISCSELVPCINSDLLLFGWLPLPLLSFMAFMSIALLLGLARRSLKQ